MTCLSPFPKASSLTLHTTSYHTGTQTYIEVHLPPTTCTHCIYLRLPLSSSAASRWNESKRHLGLPASIRSRVQSLSCNVALHKQHYQHHHLKKEGAESTLWFVAPGLAPCGRTFHSQR